MERAPVTAYVALGANLGEAAATIVHAMDSIAALPLTQITARSSLYATAPIESSGPDYVNAVVELQTRLAAPGLLRALQALEQDAGRQRSYRNAPRTLDLDLLLYGDARIDSAALTVPHPRMGQRAFVLVPLAQVAPSRVPQAQLQAVAAQPIRRLADGAAG